MLSTVLLVGAAICFAIAAFDLVQVQRVNLVPLGLLLWVLSTLV